eukprot:4015694-Lingulodinium_polyedra.AAC.1
MDWTGLVQYDVEPIGLVWFCFGQVLSIQTLVRLDWVVLDLLCFSQLVLRQVGPGQSSPAQPGSAQLSPVV